MTDHELLSSREGSQPTLRALSARAMAGDEPAFEQLHRRVGAGVRRMLLKRSGGREDLVDDLAQKTWSSVWVALRDGKYDPERSAITTFVYAVANKAWLTHLRGFAREHGYVGDGPSLRAEMPTGGGGAAAPDAGPADVAGEAEVIDVVRACLREGGPGGLTEHERIVLRAIGAGESDRGLARRLGCSSSTVNIRKHAGYAKVRAYLASLGIGDGTESEARDSESQSPSVSQANAAMRAGRGSGGGGGDEGINGALADHDRRWP